ncbi:hypothetical protein GCM10025873_01050 [Demequina sediminis]|nr:hypothetical protein GCM10025873_01050 [Demequina sediminis]
MTPTAKTAKAKAPVTQESPAAEAPVPAKDAQERPVVGRVSRVIGPVVDIEFPADAIPDIYSALKVDIDLSAQGEDEGVLHMTLEVAQHLGDNLVRAIALKPTDGLVRGAEVTDTGAPISVPVGDVTKGHVFNVTGDVLNAEPGEVIEVNETWPIHRKPPPSTSSSRRPRCSRRASRSSTCSPRTCRVERSASLEAPVWARPSSSRR